MKQSLLGIKSIEGGYPDIPVLNNLISCWELDETSGTTVVDAHGTNNGTNSGATIGATGKIDKAYSFDGVNDRVFIADNTSLDLTEAITISQWVKFSTNDSVIFAKRDTTNYAWDMNISDVGSVYFGINSNVNRADTVPFAVTLGQWYHIVGTYDRSFIKIYIDGVEQGSYAYTGAITNNNIDVTIGYRPYSGAEGYTSGIIDQSAIWNVALTQEQITALYNSGNGLRYSEW